MIARRYLGAVLAAAATFAALVAGAGSAGASAGNSTADRVNALLAHNPGATRIAADAVRVPDGTVIVVTPRSASHVCPGGKLCLFVDSNFGGEHVVLSCQSSRIDLANYFRDNGQNWRNVTSSIDNPSPSTAASFYNNGNFMLTLNGGHYLKNLASDSSADGGNANDKIDTVQHSC